MRRGARWLTRGFVQSFLTVAIAGAAVLLSFSAHAQAPAVIRPGDAAVTGFSGAKVWGEVPSDVHPLDRTFIDTSGAVLQVFDLSKLGGPPGGQVANAPAIYRALPTP